MQPYDPMPVEPVAEPLKKCNHLLHFVIGLFTCGLWWLIWPFIALQVHLENKDYLKWYAEARYRYRVNMYEWRRRNGYPI